MRMNNKKLAALRLKNDVTHAPQLKLHGRVKKGRCEAVVMSYGRNKNLDEIKTTKRRRIIAQSTAVRLFKNIAGRLPENSRNRFVDR